MSDCPQVFPHKRGTTFRLHANFEVPLTTETVTATVKRLKWSEPLQVRLLDDYPTMVELSSTDTSDWPLSHLYIDAKYTQEDGEVIQTKTYIIDCLSEVT